MLSNKEQEKHHQLELLMERIERLNHLQHKYEWTLGILAHGSKGANIDVIVDEYEVLINDDKSRNALNILIKHLHEKGKKALDVLVEEYRELIDESCDDLKDDSN